MSPPRQRIQTLRDGRLTFADDVASAIFTRATGVPWEEVPLDDSQIHVGEVQLHFSEGVTAFVRFANPALTEIFTRAIDAGIPVHKVEPVDPTDWRAGWRVIEPR